MTTRIARLLACSLVALVVAQLPATASACWDGAAISTDRVTLAVVGASSWSPERARHWAKWVARIDALVPEGKTVAVMFGELEICDVATDSCSTAATTWDDENASTLFELTADALAAPRKTIADARRTAVKPLTVQVAASHDLDAAFALASDINEAGLDLAGFFDAGGFPATNAYAHVVESSQTGDPMFHVVVGAFLGHQDAAAAQDVLESELGLRGFVRPLAQSSITAEGC